MSNARFIEVNSTYRDRKLWPLAAEFEIPISQTGTRTLGSSIDPVSLATPIFSWTGNNLIVGGGNLAANISNPSAPNSIGYTNDNNNITIVSSSQVQQLKNYYVGLNMIDTTASNLLRRISTDYYYGVDSTGKSRIDLTFYSGLPDGATYNDSLLIRDPTDFSDTYTPLIFVPDGPPQDNAFNSYILYNETINQYRPILRYDSLLNIMTLDTSGSTTATNISGPISTSGPAGTFWQTTDNFSIRKIAPTLPSLGSSGYVLTVNTSTTSTVTVVSTLLSTQANYYKNSFLRILPYSGGSYAYNFIPNVSNNNASQIVSYSYNTITNTGTFILSPSLPSPPITGSPIEILPFSYDNFNPFIYTGSLVSQQDMVCYEVQLLSLTLPNATLTVGNGGRIAYYPYVYVQLSNVSASGAGLKNIIYSNNPNATNVIFRSIIYDVQDPISTPFVRIDGGSMIQTIKFKPNDNLYFKVTLSNGETYQTILEEKYSPNLPNPKAQISAVFGIRRSQ